LTERLPLGIIFEAYRPQSLSPESLRAHRSGDYRQRNPSCTIVPKDPSDLIRGRSRRQNIINHQNVPVGDSR